MKFSNLTVWTKMELSNTKIGSVCNCCR